MLVSVVCQVTYLVNNSDISNPTTSAQAKALFFMNIGFSAASVIMGLLMLLVKSGVLGEAEKARAKARISTIPVEKTVTDDEQAIAIDMLHSDGTSASEGDAIVYQENPLHARLSDCREVLSPQSQSDFSPEDGHTITKDMPDLCENGLSIPSTSRVSTDEYQRVLEENRRVLNEIAELRQRQYIIEMRASTAEAELAEIKGNL